MFQLFSLVLELLQVCLGGFHDCGAACQLLMEIVELRFLLPHAYQSCLKDM